ncbi:MAG: polyprenyl synthetase family protein [Bacteroidales bacterium]|nr:polyprenyl synthetase family protein [Candidatus Colicola faecequi]
MIDISSAISAINWTREPQGLYDPIAYTLASGGKRLRPTLALIAAGLYGKEEKALPAALALEIFHNFTLLHDDVMDQAPIRRGRETVHVKWDDNTAILSGDQMLIEAYKQLEGIDAVHLPHVLHLFSKMGTEICEGQQYDMEFETREDVSIDEYIEMIRLKTSVLLGAALEIGAYIADAPSADMEALEVFGTNLGLAFQIQDDILDVYGDEATFGKSIGGDILQNKKSLALLMALKHANADQLARLQGWLHSTDYVPQEKIAAVTAIYNEIGVRELCEAEQNRYTRIAIESLNRMSADAAPLMKLAEKLNNRAN